MQGQNITLDQAYATLGVETGADFESVKKAYKTRALQSHPDKNPDRLEEATEEFKLVGAAYDRIRRHVERPAERPTPHYGGGRGFGGGGFSFHSFGGGGFYAFNPFGRGGGMYDSEDEDYGGEDNYYDDDDDGIPPYMRDFQFFRDLFEHLNSGRGGRPSFRSREPPESDDQRNARLERERHEAAERERRRAEEKRRAEEEVERRRVERVENAARKRANKAEKNKRRAENKDVLEAAARAELERKQKEGLERPQKTRSEVFAAARNGDSAAVRKGVWEDNVDAAGGELLKGAVDPIKNRAKGWDPLETLLHIVVSKGDLDLTEWLVDHNAEPEERDSSNRTAFHRALVCGQIEIVKYFLAQFDPASDESRAVLSARGSDTILRLAVESGKADVVTEVLKAGLVDLAEVPATWTWMDEQEVGKIKKTGGKFDKVRNVLRMVEGWTPPPSPQVDTTSVLPEQERRPSSNIQPQSPSHLKPQNPQKKGNNKKQKQNKKVGSQQHTPSPSISARPASSAGRSSPPSSPVAETPPSIPPAENGNSRTSRGNARGRGRGRGGRGGNFSTRGGAPVHV